MNQKTEEYRKLLENYARSNFYQMLREPDGQLRYPFIVPGSVYANSLWDWDSWLTDLALRGIEGVTDESIARYEKGCVLNFIDHMDDEGRMYISIFPDGALPDFRTNPDTNIHKPCLAQHALFISRTTGDFDWIRSGLSAVEKYLDYYDRHNLHESGLYVWTDDCAIGVDNDPCTFYRPKRSSASVYLNTLMYLEFRAIAALFAGTGESEKADLYEKKAENLKQAIRDGLWDERDGFYYNADVNLLPVDPENWLHSGCPRHWNLLIQRIEVWAGFMPMWAGIATPEQAARMAEHYRNPKTFNAPAGVRTLSKMEKMYRVVVSGNPSCWLGPVWGISNYLVYEGLKKYGFAAEAEELAERTLTMFGKDLEKNGLVHEYYDPETGEGISNPGFQNWNLLAIYMK